MALPAGIPPSGRAGRRVILLLEQLFARPGYQSATVLGDGNVVLLCVVLHLQFERVPPVDGFALERGVERDERLQAEEPLGGLGVGQRHEVQAAVGKHQRQAAPGRGARRVVQREVRRVERVRPQTKAVSEKS